MPSNDDWKTEYHELSEDYRHFIQMAWQSQVAVLGVDGLLVGATVSIRHASNMLGFLPLLGAFLTITMFVQQRKWILRWKGRIGQLETYDAQKAFSRFSKPETGFLKFPLEPIFPTIMVLVSAGLFGYAAFLFTTSFLISAISCAVVVLAVAIRARKLMANFAKRLLRRKVKA